MLLSLFSLSASLCRPLLRASAARRQGCISTRMQWKIVWADRRKESSMVQRVQQLANLPSPFFFLQHSPFWSASEQATATSSREKNDLKESKQKRMQQIEKNIESSSQKKSNKRAKKKKTTAFKRCYKEKKTYRKQIQLHTNTHQLLHFKAAFTDPFLFSFLSYLMDLNVSTVNSALCLWS